MKKKESHKKEKKHEHMAKKEHHHKDGKTALKAKIASK